VSTRRDHPDAAGPAAVTPRVVQLRTPALPLLVDPRVFDGFAWQASTVLEWRTPGAAIELNAFDPDLPLRMAFVLRTPWDALPTELARLHAGRGYGLTDELALAPYGIDDATDQLYAHRRAAHEVFWFAADNLNALFWGLHDWAHFHNHGAFTERAATELQCDASALAWLWLNRAQVPLADDRWEILRGEVARAHGALRAAEPPSVAADPRVLAEPRRLIELATRAEAACATAGHDPPAGRS
jgi:hypothetical protein